MGFFELLGASPAKSDSAVRIGILGASRVARYALLSPARGNPDVAVVAVAGRDRDRAARYAAKYGIPKVYSRYEELLADPQIDAVYNSLPNSLHCEWTIKALDAGKHVLCEKPMASNAEEASRMQEAAARNKRVLVEAFHNRYHPMVLRLKSLIASGELGAIRSIDVRFLAPSMNKQDIRMSYDLAGGATMDVGCYAINLVRYLAGAEPVVTTARARLLADQVDGAMDAEFEFPGGLTANMSWSFMEAPWNIRLAARVLGEKGEIRAINPFSPHFFHFIRVATASGSRSESVAWWPSTYAHQLKALVDAVRKGNPMATDGADAVLNMRVIDAVYDKAGLKKRGLPV